MDTMAPRPSTSRYILTALAIILVITTFVLIGLNAFKLQQSGDLMDAKYRQGYEAARTQDQKSFSILGQPRTTFMATVRSVSSDSLVVEAQGLGTDPVVDSIGDMRTIDVTASTTIERSVKKSPEQFAAELALAAKTHQPVPNSNVRIKISDIKEGDQVTITVTEDARNAEELRALAIVVH